MSCPRTWRRGEQPHPAEGPLPQSRPPPPTAAHSRPAGPRTRLYVSAFLTLSFSKAKKCCLKRLSPSLRHAGPWPPSQEHGTCRGAPGPCHSDGPAHLAPAVAAPLTPGGLRRSLMYHLSTLNDKSHCSSKHLHGTCSPGALLLLLCITNSILRAILNTIVINSILQMRRLRCREVRELANRE